MSAPEPGITGQPVIRSMQLSFGADGNAIYRPVTGDSTPPPPFTVQPPGNVNGGVEGVNMGEQAKKRRGRPRKYAPDVSISVQPINAVAPGGVGGVVVSMGPSLGGFSSTQNHLPHQQDHQQQQVQQQQQQVAHQPLPSQNHQQQVQQQGQQRDQQHQQLQVAHHPQLLQNHQQQVQQQDQQQVQGVAVELSGKKRGRPLGSVNRKQHQPRQQQQEQHHQQQEQSVDALGSPGIGFTPHVITVNTGEDVSSKIMSFSQNGPRAICILSANGTISSVTLRQTATSGGSVTYEGRFEILSLSGSFMVSENSGGRSRTGGLSVSLAGPDGRVIGGGVAGLLTAASPIQVVVGSFIADGRKEHTIQSPREPLFTPSRLHAMTGAPGLNNSPQSHGTLSESSDGPESPPNQSAALVNSAPAGLSNLPWK